MIRIKVERDRYKQELRQTKFEIKALQQQQGKMMAGVGLNSHLYLGECVQVQMGF